MDKIEIEEVTINKLSQLQEIGTKTFAETFSFDNSEENMRIYLAEKFSSERLRSELSDINSAFYFAVNRDAVMGYLKVNCGESQTELKDKKALEIERIYVLRDFHGKKVGQLLL